MRPRDAPGDPPPGHPPLPAGKASKGRGVPFDSDYDIVFALIVFDVDCDRFPFDFEVDPASDDFDADRFNDDLTTRTPDTRRPVSGFVFFV